jgi:hypothetical protein
VSYIDVLSASTSSASASQDLKARLAELERDPLGIANSSSPSIDVLALDRGSLTTLDAKDRTTFYAQETIFVVLRSKGFDGLMTTRFVVWTGHEVDRRDEQRQGKVDGMSRQYKTEPVSGSRSEGGCSSAADLRSSARNGGSRSGRSFGQSPCSTGRETHAKQRKGFDLRPRDQEAPLTHLTPASTAYQRSGTA